MKLLHLTHTDIYSDNRILKELKSLAMNSKYQILGYGIERNQTAVKEVEFPENVQIKSLKIKSRHLKFLPDFILHILTCIEYCLKTFVHVLYQKPEIIHCHDALVLPLGYTFKKLFGVKLVYDAHELESHQHSKNKFTSKIIFYFEKLCWSSIDLFISVSDSIISWYHQNLGEKESILILNAPYLNTNKYSWNQYSVEGQNYLRNTFNIPDDKLIFLYVGLMTKGRGIEKILSVFENHIHNSHVVFLGYGELIKLIDSKADINPNIHLHKAIKYDEVVSFSKNADIGLCLIENHSLSYYYCLPNKFFEYTFAGIPVLASNFPELKKTIDLYDLGRSCDNDTKSIVDAIMEIEKNFPKKISSDLSDLSWEAQQKKLLNAYENL